MDPNEEPPSAPPASTPDAPDQETMAQIRQRRLAKLGGPSSSSVPRAGSPATETPPTSSTPQPSTTPSQPTPAENRARINMTSSSSATPSTPKPLSRPGSTPATTTTSNNNNNNNNSAISRGKRQASDAAGSPASAPPKKQTNATATPESIEDYADRVLTSIFRITVDPNRTTDGQGHNLTFLPNLSAELAAEADEEGQQQQQEGGTGQEGLGRGLKLSVGRLEEAIMEAATAVPHERPLFEYLLPCWKRVVRILKLFRGPAPEKEALLKEARRLCFSNCIFALTVPELFSRDPNPLHDTLVPYLLREVDTDNGLCMEFFGEAVARLEEDDTIAPLFTKAMTDISSKLATLSMNDDYKPCVNALLTYSRFPPLLNAVAQHPCFQMAQSAPGIEKNTILGPFFRISPLQPEVTTVYFAGPRTMDKGRIQTSQSALQMTLQAHQSDLKTVVNAFIRASPQARNKVLDWFAYIMNANQKRRGLQVDQREVSSDGFMVNVTVILDTLCEPFMDSTFSKVGRIDVDYFRRKPRLDIKEETKLNADQAQSDAFYAKKLDGESNFITEIFFLTLAAHHYGSEAANAKLKGFDRDIKHYEKNIAMMEAERHKLLARPDQLKLLDAALKRHVLLLERVMAMKFSVEGVLLEQKMQSRSLQFMRYVTVWLLRVASQTEYTPDKPLKLPLAAEQPEAFKCLPEYALQDVVDNFKFVFRYIPQIVLSAAGDEMIALCITFLESSEYVKNPYLKSSLVTLLFQGTWPTYHLQKGVLGDLMTSTKFANDYLLHAVMKFYIECESTGVSSAFYDKFNIRYEIFQVIKTVWTNDVYRQQLVQSSKSNRSFFVRFVNLLMNDATYVLDEGLSKFPKIHDLQGRLRDPNLSQEDREKTEEELHTAENQATSYMQLANETVGMMKLFTTTLSESFTMPEIVQRLAGMLDYNLEILTGPKSKTLKVENAEKYYFNPKTLLPELVDIYLNLGSSPSFIGAVAADGRSYNPATMATTANILRTKHLKDEKDIQSWDVLAAQIESAKEALDRAEADFSDAPAEFEDPIMGILMEDPVVLPSKHVVDRSTIMQHLLSDPKDPYTRQPMTIEDVVPDEGLKARIEAWKAEKRAAAVGDVMDTTQ
ncbi:ubiquitin elongating factor core-domain-containing protein [Dichotomopilus funicola]|uniref:Ubiquitin elongating factor core-domain-containing protein n=1 Tax=Dichotomopilus funicola TaxID=1934379 RepID=A0AAN6UXU4_9PEZI|nr:ubiquitin elongating factor core-domain-containing protein [Dichotomopilus funicola]